MSHFGASARVAICRYIIVYVNILTSCTGPLPPKWYCMFFWENLLPLASKTPLLNFMSGQWKSFPLILVLGNRLPRIVLAGHQWKCMLTYVKTVKMTHLFLGLSMSQYFCSENLDRSGALQSPWRTGSLQVAWSLCRCWTDQRMEHIDPCQGCQGM